MTDRESARRPRVAAPTMRFERELLRRGFGSLAAIDEVGRGSLSGPATVGVVVVSADSSPAPVGVRDSKLLTPEARARLVPRIQRWAVAYAVGHADSTEIDRHGIVAAMRLAGHRALGQLPSLPDVVLLDGNHDYLTPPMQSTLFAEPDLLTEMPTVVTLVKADVRCAAVAAASVLAKTTRDAIMVELAAECPEYGWAENKGYAAPEHLAALTRLGPTRYHRISWNLPLEGRVTAAVG